MVSSQSKIIFLADDDLDDCFLFEEALSEIPLKVQLTIAHDGVELMKLLEKTEPLPHLVFMDLNMPLKSGFKCMEEIRLNEKLKDVAVIVLSTFFTAEISAKLLAAGVEQCLQKPNDLKLLKEIIYNVLMTERVVKSRQ